MDPTLVIALSKARLNGPPKDMDAFYDAHSFERTHQALRALRRLIGWRPGRAKIVRLSTAR